MACVQWYTTWVRRCAVALCGTSMRYLNEERKIGGRLQSSRGRGGGFT